MSGNQKNESGLRCLITFGSSGSTYNNYYRAFIVFEEVIKNTYTLDFLNLPELDQYTEGDLEQRIIDNLEKFLLELGRDFTFVGRQYKITVNNIHYRVDLVFYHRILKLLSVSSCSQPPFDHISEQKEIEIRPDK